LDPPIILTPKHDNGLARRVLWVKRRGLPHITHVSGHASAAAAAAAAHAHGESSFAGLATPSSEDRTRDESGVDCTKQTSLEAV
jgi:hypothetical protein